MSGLIRWLKFNLVGLGGVVVQLGLLEVWMHFSVGNYLLGTTMAVEAAVLHNFGWHCVFTWRDRAAPGSWVVLERAVRFHLSNGTVSLVGNVLLMRWLVLDFALPVLVANVIAIVTCSLVNFLLGDRWVFSATVVP